MVFRRRGHDRYTDMDDDKMTRELRALCYFLLGFMLSAYVTISYAETVAATTTSSTTITKLWNVSGHMAATKEAACSAYSPGWVYNGLNNGYGYGQCTKFGGDPANIGIGNCPSGTTSNGEMTCTGTVYACPSGQNWTLSGSTCTRPDCVAPQVRGNDGVCGTPARPPCDPGSSYIYDGTECVSNTCPDGSARLENGLCRGNACSGDMLRENAPGADYYLNSVCSSQGCKTNYWVNGGSTSYTRNTSGECAPSEPAKADCPAGWTIQTLGSSEKCYPSTGTCQGKGMCSGSVNGVIVCVACAPGTESKPSPGGSGGGSGGGTGSGSGGSNEKVTTPGDGSPPITESETKQRNDTVTTQPDGSRVVKSEVTTTQSDGTVTKETKTAPISVYCEENPNAAICKAEDDDCVKNPEKLSCMKAGTPTEEGAIGSKATGISSLSPVSLTTNMSCPAPVQLPNGMGEISYQGACDLAGMLRPLVLVFAWLAAGLILAGALKNG